MKLPTPKAVIFDWDNTLVDTWPVIHEALNKTFADMGTPLWTFDQTRGRVKKSMRDSFPEIFGDDWQKAAKLYQDYYRSSHLAKLEPLPRAAEVIARVKEKALFSVVVSNKKGPNLRLEVEHMGWGKYFDNVVGADDAARDKPHVDPVHMAFEVSHLKPDMNVWFVGDSEIDIECAMNTGCTAILYGTHATEQPQFSKTHYHGFPYHAHVHDHTELLELLA